MTFRLVAVSAAVLQLVGAGLIVWGLKVTTQNPKDVITWVPEGGQPHPQAAIVREHPWMVTVGTSLLLVGLALQVVAAVL